MEFNVSDFKVLNINKIQQKEIIDYGVKMVGAPLEWIETKAKNIKVGIIDTGIEATHEDLEGAVVENVDFTGENKKNPVDENGHGTHVAGIIAARENGVGVIGVAPLCSLYIAKAFDKDGNAQPFSVIKALEWMIQKNVDVINMSFSARTTTKQYDEVIKKVYDKGITMVCAAGNEGGGRDTIGYPAKYDQCIAVTAVDIDKKRADFSSQGRKAEVCAAGKNIYSCYLNNTYATLSGTSMATPIITGAVALLQSKAYKRYNRRLLPHEIRLLLHIYAENLGFDGRDVNYGYGLFTFDRLYSDTFEKSYVAKLMKNSKKKELLSELEYLKEKEQYVNNISAVKDSKQLNISSMASAAAIGVLAAKLASDFILDK
jgi:subtilisin family serine protease